MKRRSAVKNVIFALMLASAVFISPHVSLVAVAQNQDKKPYTTIRDFNVSRSSSRRFVVTGGDTMARMDIARWADKIALKVEHAVGAKLPSHPKRIIRIIVGSLDAEAGSREGKADAFVRTYVSVRGNQPVQSLVISDYKNVDLEEARHGLCRLILNSYVIDRQVGGKSLESLGQTAREAVAALYSVPHWLSDGVSQNLYPRVRATNNDQVARLWKEGKLPLVSTILASEDADDSVCGVLVDWILSLPDKSERFEKIFDRIAEGEDVSPQWIVQCIPDCSSVEDLENKWDSWILRQKWVVNVPGVATPAVLEHLRSQLLLYPGDSGIPLASSMESGTRFRELIALRKEPWIPVFCPAKTASLRLVAAGRGDELGAVVELYCQFLKELNAGKKEKQLEQSLDKADRALEELAEKLAGIDVDHARK